MLTDRHGMWEVHFNIDESGDLVIDDEELAVLHIDKEQLPTLRDWLNKVIPPTVTTESTQKHWVQS